MEQTEARVGMLVVIRLVTTGAERFGIITRVLGYPSPGHVCVDWEDGQKGLLVWTRGCANSAFQLEAAG